MGSSVQYIGFVDVCGTPSTLYTSSVWNHKRGCSLNFNWYHQVCGSCQEEHETTHCGCEEVKTGYTWFKIIWCECLWCQWYLLYNFTAFGQVCVNFCLWQTLGEWNHLEQRSDDVAVTWLKQTSIVMETLSQQEEIPSNRHDAVMMQCLGKLKCNVCFHISNQQTDNHGFKRHLSSNAHCC